MSEPVAIATDFRFACPSDVIDQQLPGSPWYWMKVERQKQRDENNPLQRAFHDWKVATRGSFISSRFQFDCAVRILSHYFFLKSKYRQPSGYPADPVAIRHELRQLPPEDLDEPDTLLPGD